MILLDANILIRASNEDDPDHAKIKKWVEEAFSCEDLVCIPWVSIWAFLRIVTNPRLFARPIPTDRAFLAVKRWVALPNVSVVNPGLRHMQLLEAMVGEGQASGPLLSDAVIAAIAVEEGCDLVSTDRDLLRFPGIRVVNPLS